MVDAGGVLWCVFFLLLILLAFVALAIVCDDYLCEAIEILCDRFKIPDDVAGASFLALGSAAPEIAISVMAVVHAASGDVKMSLPAIVGSANIAFGLIPPCCIVAASTNFMKLQWWPILRDTLSYSVCLGCNILFVRDGLIDLEEAAVLTGLFFVYMLVVYLPGKMGCCGMASSDEINENNLEEALVPGGGSDTEYGAIGLQGSGETDDPMLKRKRTPSMQESLGVIMPSETSDDGEEIAPTGCAGVCSRCMDLVYAPFEIIFSYTIPDCREEDREKYWPITFVISIAYVAVLSDAVLSMTKWCSEFIGIPASISGATVLALGAQVPDTIASMAMAKKGMADGAISNAIGSQVINVTLGTGLPFLIYAISTGDGIHMTPKDLTLLSCCLFGVMGVYLLSCFLPTTAMCSSLKKPSAGMGRLASYVLLLAFIAANVVFIVFTVEEGDDVGDGGDGN